MPFYKAVIFNSNLIIYFFSFWSFMSWVVYPNVMVFPPKSIFPLQHYRQNEFLYPRYLLYFSQNCSLTGSERKLLICICRYALCIFSSYPPKTSLNYIRLKYNLDDCKVKVSYIPWLIVNACRA